MSTDRYFKTEGTLIYPSTDTLTWGPFYYHDKNKAIDKMEEVQKYIVDWVNEQDPSLNIKPTDMIRTRDNKQIVFKIKAWRDSINLDNCGCIIRVDEIFFEDDYEFGN